MKARCHSQVFGPSNRNNLFFYHYLISFIQILNRVIWTTSTLVEETSEVSLQQLKKGLNVTMPAPVTLSARLVNFKLLSLFDDFDLRLQTFF